VVASARAVAESDEFHSLVQSLRAHAAATLHSLGDLLDETPEAMAGDNVVARVRRMMEQSSTSNAS